MASALVLDKHRFIERGKARSGFNIPLGVSRNGDTRSPLFVGMDTRWSAVWVLPL